MKKKTYRSWGLVPDVEQSVCVLDNIFDADQADKLPTQNFLGYGCGSSYGDVCLNDEGILLDTQRLDRFLYFDSMTGVLRCQAGVTLWDINQIFVARGWFLPVTPGTQNVTVAGAIANDVHGKNHHQAGSFGCHILKLSLYRSETGTVECSEEQHQDLFQATIGGLGLTGFIQWAELQLKPVAGPYLQTRKMLFGDLQEFAALTNATDQEYEYTVAWLDSVAGKKSMGRGVFFCGNHSENSAGKVSTEKASISIPFNAPSSLLSYPIVKLFNSFYYNAHRLTPKEGQTYYAPFFYPLDSISQWNRLYGRKGFFQYQCVVPLTGGIELIQELLSVCAHYAQGSFLSVLKKFGDIRSPGMLSFPRPGYTLALDFRNRGDATREMLVKLDDIVFKHGGALYPAKDARMSPVAFERSFPQYKQFMQHIDHHFSSNFFRRAIVGQVQ